MYGMQNGGENHEIGMLKKVRWQWHRIRFGDLRHGFQDEGSGKVCLKNGRICVFFGFSLENKIDRFSCALIENLLVYE
jgi:hypothetical protein